MCTIAVALALGISWVLPLYSNQDQGDALAAKFTQLREGFKEKLKTIETRDAYKKLLDEKNKDLENLLQEVGRAPAQDKLVLLEGKILLELRKYPEARQKLEILIDKGSELSLPAKFENIKIYLAKNEVAEALKKFQEIEKSVPKNDDYFWVLLDLAMRGPDAAVKELYCQKFIKEVGNAKEFQGFKAMIFSNLADAARDKGDLKKGKEILKKGLTQVEGDDAKETIQASLTQLDLFYAPAPELKTDTWINTTPLTLAGLKGKVVLIDFWATWCGPCRMVIPNLVKLYNQNKDKGLVIIGFTQLYGNYNDDAQSKGKVTPEEEIALIKEFVARQQITYPITVAKVDDTFKRYGVMAIPTLIIIDKKGIIQEVKIGAGDEKELEEKISQLLR
jgi:thiol-disulfide isomerase/thioredoxin